MSVFDNNERLEEVKKFMETFPFFSIWDINEDYISYKLDNTQYVFSIDIYTGMIKWWINARPVGSHFYLSLDEIIEDKNIKKEYIKDILFNLDFFTPQY